MSEAFPVVLGADCIKVTDEPSGDRFRKITIEWTDVVGNIQRRAFMGASAVRVHAELAECTRISEAARRAYLIGLISAFTIVGEKLPQLAVV